jgi:hypothetical protein
LAFFLVLVIYLLTKDCNKYYGMAVHFFIRKVCPGMAKAANGSLWMFLAQ